MKISLAVIYGGQGREHEVSVMGFKSLSQMIRKEKYKLHEIFIDKSGAWYYIHGDESYPTFPVRLGGKRGFLVSGRIIPCDIAFPLLHGDMGEDGNIQGLLTSVGIPFVGEGTRTGALTSDKAYTKIIAESVGVPTVRSVTLFKLPTEEAAEKIEREIGYPVFIKPASLGSSFGASGAASRDELAGAYGLAASLDERVLAEELVSPKRELECAVLKTGDGFVITPPSEIIISGEYGYNEKYKGGTPLRVSADVSEEIASTLRGYCGRLIDALGIESMSRIDFFLSGDRIFFNEINSMPGFTKDSLYVRMLEGVGIASCEVIDILVANAVEKGR